MPPSRLLRAVLVGAAALVAAGLASRPATPILSLHARLVDSQFVTAQGTQLYLNGMPWDFTGYDAYQLPSIEDGYNCGGYYSDDQLDEILSQMRQNSGSVAVRTWFFQSYGGPGNWSQFDRVLNAAAQYDIKVIPVLVNEWGDCEPWPNGTMPYRDLAWYQSGYKETNDGYPLSFRDFAIAMAQHYANNPTIAFWQLVNEAEDAESFQGTCDNDAGGDALRSFADDVAGAMKAVDPNHLISLGTIGGGQCGTQGAEYEYVHAGNIDLCEIHDYWQGALGGSPWNGAVSSIDACHDLNKPIFTGEAGIDASVQPDWSTTGVVTPQTLQQRAEFFQEKMNAQFALGTVGFLVWSKSLGPSSSYDVGPGDPTEAVMLAEQTALDQRANQLESGQVITGGDPAAAVTTQDAPGIGAASAATAAAAPPAAAPPGEGADGGAPSASARPAIQELMAVPRTVRGWLAPRLR